MAGSKTFIIESGNSKDSKIIEEGGSNIDGGLEISSPNTSSCNEDNEFEKEQQTK